MDVDEVPEQQITQPRGNLGLPGQPLPLPPPCQPPSSTDALLLQCMQVMTQILQRQANPNPEAILDSLASNVKEFRFDADGGVTFQAWYDRYEDLFVQDAARLDDPAKVRLLLRKLGIAEHERYISYILPLKPCQLDFAATIQKLKSLFCVQESVVSRRYKCLQIAKSHSEDHVAYACRVNKMCVGFDLGQLTQDQFKCLVYVCGLKSETDVEIRTRLLSRIEECADVTLEQISEESQRLLNLKHDSAMIEAPTYPSKHVNVLKQKPTKDSRYKRHDQTSSKQAAANMKGKPQTPCWFCGALHYVRDCTFKTHRCSDCNQIGHREGYCDSAKKSRKSQKGRRQSSVYSSVVVVNECTVQKRRKYVTVGLNGTRIRLQLDTASDITVIGRQIWEQIGSPVLSPATVKATTASGNVLQLVGEFTCDITIGD